MALARLAYFVLGVTAGLASTVSAQALGGMWGTAHAEAEYYRIVDVPVPERLKLETGSLCALDEGRLAIGTRRGEILIVDGAFDRLPKPRFRTFASGLDEVLGLGFKDGAFYATQQAEVSRIRDINGDGRADRFENLSDAWGFKHYHEFAFGSPVMPDGSIYVALGLSASYHYRAVYRGCVFRVAADGRTAIPIANGVRSAGGIASNEHGEIFYIESQGPWNGSCSLKHVRQGAFLGHPVCRPAYDLPLGKHMGPKPEAPKNRSRLHVEAKRIPQLDPYAVVFPYRKMGQSLTAFRVDRTKGRFGPFAGQIFLGDFALSIVVRATTEKVDGVWQGACYPFREGLGNRILAVEFSPRGYLMTGGTNRGWPVRGNRSFLLQRLEWTGRTPFEIERITARPDGFRVRFTQSVDAESARKLDGYRMESFTHIFRQGYGSPEVDKTTPRVTRATVSSDGRTVDLVVSGLVEGHMHAFELAGMRNAVGKALLHTKAYYTLNKIPAAAGGEKR